MCVWGHLCKSVCLMINGKDPQGSQALLGRQMCIKRITFQCGKHCTELFKGWLRNNGAVMMYTWGYQPPVTLTEEPCLTWLGEEVRVT